MKNTKAHLIVAMLALCVTATAFATPNDDPVPMKLQAPTAHMSSTDWANFSDRLVAAIATQHDGLQAAAMRYVIQYSGHLDVDAAVFDVMRIYRDHENDQMRRMAVVALGQMDSRWAILFLDRSADFEKSPAIKKTIRAVVAQHKL